MVLPIGRLCGQLEDGRKHFTEQCHREDQRVWQACAVSLKSVVIISCFCGFQIQLSPCCLGVFMFCWLSFCCFPGSFQSYLAFEENVGLVLNVLLAEATC